MIDTTTDQNLYDQGINDFNAGYTKMVNDQNTAVDATKSTFDPQIKTLQDQVSGFNNQIQGIKSTLNTLPENVRIRGNGMGSDAQLSRQTTAEATPLQTNLAQLGLAVSPLNESLGTTRASEQDALSALSDKFARESTGYTLTHQATLNGLLDKLTRDRTLNDTEMAQAYDLAKMDKQYQQTLSLQRDNNSSISNPFLSGTTTPTPTASNSSLQSPDDIVKELKSAFAGGSSSWDGKDNSIIQGIVDDTGLSQQEATNLYYQTRKPFETAPVNQSSGIHLPSISKSTLLKAAPSVLQSLSNPVGGLVQGLGTFGSDIYHLIRK